MSAFRIHIPQRHGPMRFYSFKQLCCVRPTTAFTLVIFLWTGTSSPPVRSAMLTLSGVLSRASTGNWTWRVCTPLRLLLTLYPGLQTRGTFCVQSRFPSCVRFLPSRARRERAALLVQKWPMWSAILNNGIDILRVPERHCLNPRVYRQNCVTPLLTPVYRQWRYGKQIL